jgi:hypothetical protein
MVIWAECKPEPVAATAQHSFKVENARTSLWPQDVTSAAVKVSSGRRADLQLVKPDGSLGHLVAHPGTWRVNQGCQTSAQATAVRKVAGRPAGSEHVETTVSFMAVAPAGKVLPTGTGAKNMTFAIPVRIA